MVNEMSDIVRITVDRVRTEGRTPSGVVRCAFRFMMGPNHTALVPLVA